MHTESENVEGRAPSTEMTGIGQEIFDHGNLCGIAPPACRDFTLRTIGADRTPCEISMEEYDRNPAAGQEKQLDCLAPMVRRYCDDLLRGDWSLWDALEERRQQEIALVLGPAEVAATGVVTVARERERLPSRHHLRARLEVGA